MGAQRNEDVTRSRAMIESYLLRFGVNWREVGAMRPFPAGGPPWLLRLTREGFPKDVRRSVLLMFAIASRSSMLEQWKIGATLFCHSTKYAQVFRHG